MRRGAGLCLAVAALILCPPLRANEPPGTPPAMASAMLAASQRFPQQVRVGDLFGRNLIEPVEAQPVLGYVAQDGVIRTADGALELVIRRDGWLSFLGFIGFHPSRVALPIADVALMGEHTVLVGLTPAAFAALPASDTAHTTRVPADTQVTMGILGPFH